MKFIFVIGRNTFHEIIRDRILYGIIAFALFLIGMSLALGELSFAEQARITADFGFTGIHLGMSILSIFVGSSLVAKEIEKQTILTLLARPISRTQFLLGKYLGFSTVIGVVLVGLAIVLGVVIGFLGLPLQSSFFIALVGIYFESLILMAMSLLFGTLSRPMMTVIFTVSIFLIGHWVSSLQYFAEKSTSKSFRAVAELVQYLMPNFEKLNWRSAPIYQDVISIREFVMVSGYTLGWILVILTITSWLFRRKDFV